MTAPVVIAARLARHTAAALEALGDGRNAPAAGHIRKATKALEEAGPAWEEAECALFDIADYLESGPDWESLADTAAAPPTPWKRPLARWPPEAMAPQAPQPRPPPACATPLPPWPPPKERRHERHPHPAPPEARIHRPPVRIYDAGDGRRDWPRGRRPELRAAETWCAGYWKRPCQGWPATPLTPPAKPPMTPAVRPTPDGRPLVSHLARPPWPGATALVLVADGPAGITTEIVAPLASP